MKTFPLLLLLLLATLDLRAQVPSATPQGQADAAARRLARRQALMTNNPAAPTTPAALGSLPSTSPIITTAAAPTAGRAAAGGAVNGAINGAAAANGAGVNGGATAAATASEPPEEIIPANTINFQGVDVNQVLEVYAKLVGRTLLRGQVPQASIILKTETPLTKSEVIQALQAVLSLNGVALIDVGDKFVKVLPITEAGTAGGKINETDAAHLPELGTYVTHIVQLKYLKPSAVVPLITPFSKLANAVVPIEDNGILVLRDNAENVKRMLEMIARIDVSVPAEYISEVIPIKYAQASDIANALNSLGGSGGGTVSIGSTPSGRVSGLGGSRSSFGGTGGSGSTGGGLNGIGGGAGGSAFGSQGQTSAFGATGATTANGTPSTGNTFQQRLNSIISSATGGGGGGGVGGKQDAIQVFGQTKIIADQRSNALLVFATRSDMENIKHVISQLDVLLAQVLIEAVIMDVNVGSTLNYGVSAAQNPQGLGTANGQPIVGAGGYNNGTGFLSTLTNVTSSGFANNLGSGSGFSYFGNIGPNYDLAVSALAGNNNATVIQRPRIQTSQAKPATFFVGNTVPYVTGTYYGGGYSGGNSSQYSQLSVGVELDVTPFINPDGLVVMDINQEIDDIQGYTSIDGNQVPNTDKRTLSSEIAVRSLDTIMMGGFIRTDKTKTSSGVPILQDIPILGNLFSSHANSKTREELLVLMRPTVMTTPEAASEQTLREERRLPEVSAAAADDAAAERTMVAAERKAELQRAKISGQNDGYFNQTNTLLQTDRVGLNTNPPAPVYQFNPVIQNEPAAPDQPAAPAQPPVVPAQPATPNP